MSYISKLCLLNLFFCAVFIASFEQAAAREIRTPHEAVYKAINQSMLTQRMLKNYVLIGMGVRARKAQEELSTSINAFDSQIAELLYFARDDLSREHLRNVNKLWKELKPYYLSPPNRSDVQDLRERTEELLRTSDKVVLSFQRQTDFDSAYLAGLSGRQAVLSQRIAALYSLMAWGYEKQYLESYKTSYNQFSDALAFMEASQINTPFINKALYQVKRQFRRFAFSGKRDNGHIAYAPALINHSAEKILERINQVTGLYASLTLLSDQP